MVLAGVAVAVLVATQVGPVQRAAEAAGLLPKPPGFVELYFDGSQRLPVSVGARSQYAIVFTVANRFGTDRSYGYRVTQGARTVTVGRFTLAGGRQLTLTTVITFPPRPGLDRIAVDLTPGGPSIDWLVTVRPAAARGRRGAP